MDGCCAVEWSWTTVFIIHYWALPSCLCGRSSAPFQLTSEVKKESGYTDPSATPQRRVKVKMSISPQLIFSFVLISVAATVFPVLGTDHIVGANRGWNPGINYTLWANNHTFYVGDLISFRYQKNQYNVFEVNQSGYDNCTTEGAFGNWSSGKDFIPLNEAKRYYFICGNGQCFNGMKVTVLVHPLSPPPSSLLAGNHSGPSSAAPAVGSQRRRLQALLISLALTWFGSEWI